MAKPTKTKPTAPPQPDKPQTPPEPEKPAPKMIMVKEGFEGERVTKTSEKKN